MIIARNVNGALSAALALLESDGIAEDSRNGLVLRIPYPVTITYESPQERVLFSPVRDANPYFHFAEALWMLAGRNDLGWIQQFNSRIGEYSDDGEILHGAYGFRWRKWFGIDQLKMVIEHLRSQPNSRRAVLQMWSPCGDLLNYNGCGGLDSKDLPCNLMVLFGVTRGRLDMSVFNRSNDAIWGAFGANAVHMSFLQEYVAAALQISVGRYYQISNNLHVYTDRFPCSVREQLRQDCEDRYATGAVSSCPILDSGESIEQWDADLELFMSMGVEKDFRTVFFREIAAPMWRSWWARKRKMNSGREDAECVVASDWKTACVEWIDRREQKKVVDQCSE